MDLDKLPIEILIIIIKKLDVLSAFNLHGVSVRVKNLIRHYKIIKTCDFSLSPINSVQILQSNYLNDLSQSLQDLNVAGMANLNKSLILQVAKTLKNLKTLNIAYTNISLLDFNEIHQLCPTIKNICVNFNLGEVAEVPKTVLLQCQDTFKNLECVHFVGNSSNLLFSGVALYVLEEANLKTLYYTINGSNTIVYDDQTSEKTVQFDSLEIYIPSMKASSSLFCYMSDFFIFNKLDAVNFEFIVIDKLHLLLDSIYTTPLFENVFTKNLTCHILTSTNFDLPLNNNVRIMLWDKKRTTFDAIFFRKLVEHTKRYFPYLLHKSIDVTLPFQHNWYLILYPTEEFAECTPGTAQSNKLCLDYDTIFKDKKDFELSLLYNNSTRASAQKSCGTTHLTVCLSDSYEYLKKITYLSLTGSANYSADFFDILFRSCDRLVTLNITCQHTFFEPIVKAIPLNHSIKNLRCVCSVIDFPTMLSSLSQCENLENVHLFQTSNERVDCFDPNAMFQKCTNLYCFYVHVFMDEATLAKQLQMLNKAKELCQRDNINVNAFLNNIKRYDLFVNVFKTCATEETFSL